MAITLEELEIKFTAQMGNMNQQLADVRKKLKGVQDSAEKASGGLKLLQGIGKVIGGAMIGRKLIGIGKDALMMANDAVESEELFAQSMGRMAAKARSWSEELSASLGLNAYEVRKNVGMLNVMFRSMGLNEEEAYNMAASMTKLGNDMASFYNLDPEEAFTKLRAGITGETEPLKRLGILVDEATIKQYALKHGISKTGKELTQQQKLQARYRAIMEQTVTAQGDLARTMDSPTNQLRRLTAEFDQAKIALGTALQPALISIMPALTGFARGMTAIMTGVRPDNPMGDVVISLTNATNLVKQKIGTLKTDAVEHIKGLSKELDTAIDDFNKAAKSTKTAYLTIELQPETTAYERIYELLTDIEDYANQEAETTYIKESIMGQIDAALEDGEVDPKEIEDIRNSLEAQINALLLGEEKILADKKAEIELKLNKGEINIEEAKRQNDELVKDYTERTEAIKLKGIEIAAELGIKDWTAKSLSVGDRQSMRKALQAELDAGAAVVLQAQAMVGPLFDETGGIGAAVEGVYSSAIARMGELNKEMDALMQESIETDWDWSKINELRQEYTDIVDFLTKGITGEGELNKAVFDLREITPESLKNFGEAYTGLLNEQVNAERKMLTMRENVLFSLKGEELTKQLKKWGYKDFESAIDDLRAQSAAAEAKASETILTAMVGALAPGIQGLMDDPNNVSYSDAISMYESLKKVLDQVKPDQLSESGKTQYDMLSGMVEDMDQLQQWLDLIYNNPFLKEQLPPWKQEGGPAMVTDRPAYTERYTTPVLPKDGGSPAPQIENTVSVNVTPHDVVLNLDGLTVARTAIRYTPQVLAQLGKPVFQPGGAGGIMGAS